MLLTVDEFKTRLGDDLYDDDIDRAQLLIEDISAIACDEAGVSWDANTAPRAVIAIVAKACIRAWNNPEGYSSQQLESWSGEYGPNASDYFTLSQLVSLRKYRNSLISVTMTTGAENAAVPGYRVAGTDFIFPA